MHQSNNRDIYYNKLITKCQKDETMLIQELAKSPYRKHKRMASTMLEVVKVLKERMDAAKAQAEVKLGE